MNAAFCLCAAILVGQAYESAFTLTCIVQPRSLVALEFKVNKLHTAVLGNWNCVLGITNGRIALGVQWVVRNLVLGNVLEGVLQCPVGEWIALGQTSANGGILEGVNPRPLEALPPGTAIDHAVSLECLEATLERFDLADLVVLLDVLLPQVGTVLFVVRCFITHWHALRTEDLCLEAVVLLNALHELHGLIEEMESVNHHDLDFAILEVA
mmetsp:Transcript_71676/g.118697  ORF Transcript_71676/g.118697 Transcript_71676/m.118697 type:complete len:211 (-) Transcript_71676:457-1089(-)